MPFSQQVRAYVNKAIVQTTYWLLNTTNRKELAKRALIKAYISELFEIDFREGQKFLHNGAIGMEEWIDKVREDELDWAITRINYAIAEYKGK